MRSGFALAMTAFSWTGTMSTRHLVLRRHRNLLHQLDDTAA